MKPKAKTARLYCIVRFSILMTLLFFITLQVCHAGNVYYIKLNQPHETKSIYVPGHWNNSSWVDAHYVQYVYLKNSNTRYMVGKCRDQHNHWRTCYLNPNE